MKALALGLIPVPTAGTPVKITAAMLLAAGGGLSPSGQVYRIDFNARVANTGITYVKEVATGNIIKGMLAPGSGYVDCWFIESNEGDEINPLDFSIDAATNNDGVYVTAWVR